MSNNCSCKVSCTTIAIISSIIVGIVSAILRYTAIITVSATFLWAIFGVALGLIFLLLVLATTLARFNSRGCVCPNVSAVLIGAIGTILFSLLLLGIEFAATSAIGAIITGGFFASLALIVGATVCLVKCIVGCFFGD